MAPTRKLTGAQATLFAEICENYIHAAEVETNAAPDKIPVFSWLSPQQRLKLVKDVMIGVLCENEPLPPNTIQHNATYRALIETLFCELEMEQDMLWDCDDVGEDLLNHDKSDDSQKFYTPEEQKERAYQRDLIEHRAERNMNKMKRKDVGKFAVEEDYTVSKVTEENLNGMMNNYRKIFEGGPVSVEERKSIRSLSDDELHAFRWRRLCDAALQEDFTPPFPLAAVNFDWRCQQCNKWYLAINLVLDTHIMRYGSPTDRALIIGEIDEYAYADPSQLPRIREVEKHVELLRKVYESTWDEKELSIDQRCIFAVCSNEAYAGYGHKDWVAEFIVTCNNRGIDFKAGGNFQARLDIFREMKDKHTEGLRLRFGCENEWCAKRDLESGKWKPQAYQPEYKFEGVRCHGPGNETTFGLGCWETKNLKSCARCKVVMYCSAECQRADWKEHKKVCSQLAKERKDKEKIAQLAAKG